MLALHYYLCNMVEHTRLRHRKNSKKLDDSSLSKQNDDQEVESSSLVAAAAAVDISEGNSSLTSSALQQQIFTARLLLVTTAALYGTSFSSTKILGESLPVGIGSTLRFSMAAAVTAPWLFQNKSGATAPVGVDGSSSNNNTDTTDSNSKTRTNKKEQLRVLAAGLEVGIWDAIGFVAQAVGLETTLASKSAFLCSLSVIVVPLLDYLAGQRLNRRQLIGAALALLGVALLELRGGGEHAHGDGDSNNEASSFWQFQKGDIASLIQPLAFGMAFWRCEKAMHHFPDAANRLTAAQLLAVCLGSLLYTAVTDLPSLLNHQQILYWLSDPHILAALVWSGIVTTALAVYLETVALKTLSAAETVLIFSTEPIWGSITAAVVMGETFGLDSVTGGALILTGCVYSNLGWNGIQQLFSSKKNNRKEEGVEVEMK